MSLQNSKAIEDVKVLLVKGERGVSIVSIEKTLTEGLVDTYTVTMSDGSKSSFTVTNGNGITSVTKTGTSGNVDTYTITFDNGNTETFTVTNGNGIASLVKTGTVGLVDTYTITFDNGSTETFTVTNGRNGTDASLENLATVEEGSTASKAYAVGEHVIYNGLYYIVTAPIASGGTFTVGTNIEREAIGDEITELNTEISNLAEQGFNRYYGLITKTTAINKDTSGVVTNIVETSSEAVATTTFSTSGSTKTITTQIVPTSGDYNYTKTATITSGSSGVSISETYTRTAKGA